MSYIADKLLSEKNNTNTLDDLILEYEEVKKAIQSILINKEYKIKDKTYTREDLDMVKEYKMELESKIEDCYYDQNGGLNPKRPYFIVTSSTGCN